ncbi:MAG: hypothetical protein AVDCRST_MAG19-4118, partial [uncultured Thermomicrobiales bacterium]
WICSTVCWGTTPGRRGVSWSSAGGWPTTSSTGTSMSATRRCAGPWSTSSATSRSDRP